MSAFTLSTAAEEELFGTGSREAEDPPKYTQHADESVCWSEAKARFRKKLQDTKSPPSKDSIKSFLENNTQIDDTIIQCQKLQRKADGEYGDRKSSRFIGKLLEVLVVVKNVGDPLLQCAPESVSLAWSAISLLISLGINDVENCGRISEACVSIATIVLNCRLYEKRYHEKDASNRIIESVKDILTTALEFFWLANKKLKDKKIKRLFRDIFDPTVNETYETVIKRYKDLREDTELAFQERVMDAFQELNRNIKKGSAETAALLFPALQDISNTLHNWENLKTLQREFRKRRNDLKPTETHRHQLEATIQPLSHGTAHLCQWLFEDKQYQSWERIHRPENDRERKFSLVRRGTVIQSQPNPEKVPPTKLLYITGRAGFGKSVMMATVIERLKRLTEKTLFSSEKETTKLHYPVLYFFFKRGDDSTQLTAKAFSSLVTQLFDEDHAYTSEQMESFIRTLDSFEKTPPNKPKEDPTGTVSNKDLLKVEGLATTLGRTVYIVIDGIDECTDYESQGLVSELIKLARSEKASFKILMSSREDLKIEHLFAKDEEARRKFDFNQKKDVNIQELYQSITHEDTTILALTENTNHEDMKRYLNTSLQELMRNRLPKIPRSNQGDYYKKKLSEQVSNIAKVIQEKAEGMFTYSTMAIKTLSQPSPLSLTERLRDLPKTMDDLYSKQLEAVTGAEKNLIILALERIVWSSTDMGTVEIAEQFKKIYLRDIKDNENQSLDESDVQSTNGSITEDEASLEEELINPIDKAMLDPEIADTIYHLGRIGRNFFKFSNERRVIGVIHKSVRDWVESESKKAAQRDGSTESLTTVSWDTGSGELKLTLPIPHAFMRGQSGSLIFQSELDTHLDILIYTLRVLIHPKFQEEYMPLYDPSEYRIEEDIALELAGPSDADESVSDINEILSDDDGMCGSENSREDDHGKSRKETFHLGPWRCEIHQWLHHIKRIGELWPREERKGKKWDELTTLLRKFIEPLNFKRWVIQFHQIKRGGTLEEGCRVAESMDPVFIAASHGLEVFMEFLIEEPTIDLGKPLRPGGWSALHFFHILYFPETVQRILETKLIDANRKDMDGSTPLRVCLGVPEFNDIVIDRTSRPVKNLIQTIKILVGEGASLEDAVVRGEHPLQYIIRIGDESLFDLFMAKENPKVNVNFRDQSQRTALHTVADCISWRDDDGKNCFTDPAHRAVLLSMTRKLLQAGADPNARDQDGYTPIFNWSTQLCQTLKKEEQEFLIPFLDLLIEFGADITPRDNEGWKIFQYSFLLHDHCHITEATIRLCRERGHDFSFMTKPDDSGQTILHRIAAAYQDSPGSMLVGSLLEELSAAERLKFLEIKEPDQGRTALFIAVDADNPEFAAWLLGWGADTHTVDGGQQTIGDILPESWKRARCHEEISVRLNSRSKAYTTLHLTARPPELNNQYLHDVVSDGMAEAIERVAQSGLDPSKKDADSWDAFDWAFACNQHNLLRECFPEHSVDYEFRQINWEENFQKITAWGPQISDPDVTFLDDITCQVVHKQLTFRRFIHNRFTVLTNHPVCPYMPEFYYEVTIISLQRSQTPFVAVGLSESGPDGNVPGLRLRTRHSPFLGEFNANVTSYSFHSSDGLLRACEHPNEERVVDTRTFESGEEARYGVGDTVGCGYNNIHHTIFWTLNGRYLGVVFEGVYRRLYPALSVKNGFTVSANFGNDPNKPFKWNGSKD